VGRRIGGAVRNVWRAYWRRRAGRATLVMLQALDDRALKDIGIDRSEIESVVYGDCGSRRGRGCASPSEERRLCKRL
jgi:uncharacterized protein YjiS (DUF1127 family)